ncbi:TetR family transcriptional regulator [Haladaptatus sp. W1]|nr:TetR family transcriptional regulator [Haladaptatus sp. W1]
MQRIAEESSITTAAIHYHFDTKEDLLNAFLDDLIKRFEAQLACEACDPRERLDSFLDAVYTPSETGDDDFPVGLMELKAQAPYHNRVRERFLELDEMMQSVVASIVRDGVDAEHFEEANPEEIARLVTTLANGGHTRTVALGENPVRTRQLVERVLELRLGWTPNSGVDA